MVFFLYTYLILKSLIQRYTTTPINFKNTHNRRSLGDSVLWKSHTSGHQIHAGTAEALWRRGDVSKCCAVIALRRRGDVSKCCAPIALWGWGYVINARLQYFNDDNLYKSVHIGAGTVF